MLLTFLKSTVGKVIGIDGNGFLYLGLGLLAFFIVSNGMSNITDALGITTSKTELSYSVGKLKNQLDSTITANNGLVNQLELNNKSSEINLKIVTKATMSSILRDRNKEKIETIYIAKLNTLIEKTAEPVTNNKTVKNKLKKSIEKKEATVFNNDEYNDFKNKTVTKLAKQIEKVSINDKGITVIIIDKVKMEQVSYANIKSIWDTYETLNMRNTTSV